MQILNRTAAAFVFSCERLWEQSRGKVYFWTFTFKEVPSDDRCAMQDWHDFHRRLCRAWPALRGIRVAELHRSHGLHFHALVNMRIPIKRVMRLAEGTGRLIGVNRYLDFGRMDVVRVKSKGVFDYLAKYLAGTYTKKYQLYGGRRWGTIGGFNHCRKVDVVYDSPWHRNRISLFGEAKVDYFTCVLLGAYTKLWGPVSDWPKGLIRSVYENGTRPKWASMEEIDELSKKSWQNLGPGDGNSRQYYAASRYGYADRASVKAKISSVTPS